FALARPFGALPAWRSPRSSRQARVVDARERSAGTSVGKTGVRGTVAMDNDRYPGWRRESRPYAAVPVAAPGTTQTARARSQWGKAHRHRSRAATRERPGTSGQ